MERFRCTNPECKQPVLFEGRFVGVIIKKCPKCKKTIVIKREDAKKFEKLCNYK